MSATLIELLEQWNASGRIATVHSRLKRISFNGGKSKTYTESITYLKECLK